MLIKKFSEEILNILAYSPSNKIIEEDIKKWMFLLFKYTINDVFVDNYTYNENRLIEIKFWVHLNEFQLCCFLNKCIMEDCKLLEVIGLSNIPEKSDDGKVIFSIKLSISNNFQEED